MRNMRTVRVQINFVLDARAIALCVVIASLGQIAWAALFTNVIGENLWSRYLAIQGATVSAGCGISVALAAYLNARQILSSYFVLLILLTLLTALLYGASATISVVLFFMGGLAAGCHIQTALRGRSSDSLVNVLTGLAALALINTMMAPWALNTWLTHAGLTTIPIAALALAPQARAVFFAQMRDGFIGLRRPVEHSLTDIALAVWATTLAAWFLILGALPELYHDGLAVHLYMASYMRANGAWSYDPSLYAFAFMPAAITHLYGHFYILAGEQAARLFNVLMLFSTCMCIVALARQFATKTAALASALLFASTPLAHIETVSLFVENGLALWTMGSAYVIVTYWNRASDVVAPALALLAAACATKLHGVVVAGLFGSVFFWRVIVQVGVRQAVRTMPLVMAFAALGVFPYVFSYAVTSNPVFPFYNDVFKSPYFLLVRLIDARWLNSVWPNPLFSLSIHSPNFLESWRGAGGFAWMTFLPAAIPLAFMAGRRYAPRICLIFGLILSVIILSQIRYLRYIYPFLPLLCMPIAYTISVGSRGAGRYVFATIITVVALLNAYKIPAAGWVLRAVDLRAAVDSDVANQLERAFVPHRIANREVNRLAGRGARVLYVGAPFGGLLEGTAIYSNWYALPFRQGSQAVHDNATARSYVEDLKVDFVIHDGDTATPFGASVLSAMSAAQEPLMTVGKLTLWKVK